MYGRKQVIIPILFLLCMLISCKPKDNYIDPEIKVSFTITKLTDKDFEDIGTKGVTKEDFRKLHFSLNVNQCSDITNRKITVPDLRNVLNSYDKERYWYGEYTSLDTPGEDALYSYDIMLLSSGLSDEDIKDIFDNARVTVTWTDKKGEEINRNLNLVDYIEFK